jgi:hypothetical protein
MTTVQQGTTDAPPSDIDLKAPVTALEPEPAGPDALDELGEPVDDDAPVTACVAPAPNVVTVGCARFYEPHVAYLGDRSINPEVGWREGVRSGDAADVYRGTGCTVVGTAPLVGYDGGYTLAQLDDRANNEGKTRARAGVTPPPFIPSTVSLDGDEPLIIVEGPLKALALVSNGFRNAVGACGVTGGILVPKQRVIQGHSVRICAAPAPSSSCSTRTG